MTNDRFRFRAWHKPTKKLFDVFSFTDEIVFENTLDGVGNSPTNPAKLADCVLEQCTGLKDKNGKLIYEGDIVRVKGDVLTIPIEYENEKAFVNWYECGFFLHFESSETERLFQECWEYEVVGNIHENPELLEGRK